MRPKYQRNSRARAIEPMKPPQGEIEPNSLLRESAEQIKRHEELTGINRAKWDEVLHARAAAHTAIFEARNYDV